MQGPIQGGGPAVSSLGWQSRHPFCAIVGCALQCLRPTTGTWLVVYRTCTNSGLLFRPGSDRVIIFCVSVVIGAIILLFCRDTMASSEVVS